MGCSCKKTFNKMEKYSDDYQEPTDDKKQSLFLKIVNFLILIVTAIFSIGLFIIILPIALPYYLIYIILGHAPKITIKKKYFKGNKPLIKTYYGQH